MCGYIDSTSTCSIWVASYIVWKMDWLHLNDHVMFKMTIFVVECVFIDWAIALVTSNYAYLVTYNNPIGTRFCMVAILYTGQFPL